MLRWLFVQKDGGCCGGGTALRLSFAAFCVGLDRVPENKNPQGAAGNAVFWGGPLYCKGADDIEENFPELGLLI